MTHQFICRVYYEDTDLAGIVYYANYLKFIERARSEWVRELGIDQGALRDEKGLVFAVRRVEADYLRPAKFDDILSIETSVERITAARLVLTQDVKRDMSTLFQAQVTLVFMDFQGRPQRFPANIRQLLSK